MLRTFPHISQVFFNSFIVSKLYKSSFSNIFKFSSRGTSLRIMLPGITFLASSVRFPYFFRLYFRYGCKIIAALFDAKNCQSRNINTAFTAEIRTLLTKLIFYRMRQLCIHAKQTARHCGGNRQSDNHCARPSVECTS